MKEFDFYVNRKVSVWREDHVTVRADSLEEAIRKCSKGKYLLDYENMYYMWDTEEDVCNSRGIVMTIYRNRHSHNPIYKNVEKNDISGKQK